MKAGRIDKYRKIKRVGEGAYGVVYEAEDVETGLVYALKKIRLESEDEGIPSTAIREIALLLELQHPNIVKLENVLHTDKKLTLVFEFMNCDLKDKLTKAGTEGLSTQEIKNYLFQTLAGLAKCHQNKVLHRDLKPQNLLLNKEGILKLADFGLARAFGIPVKTYSHEVVTLWYRPPDVLLGSNQYGKPIDIWSVGCIFAEMINNIPLFQGKDEGDQLYQIVSKIGFPSIQNWNQQTKMPLYEQYKDIIHSDIKPSNLAELIPSLDEQGIDLMEKMLKVNPDERITAKQALQHPFLNDVPQEIKDLA